MNKVKPEIGEQRWSDYFKSYVILARYISNDWWYFYKVDDPHKIEYRANTKWSVMKSKP